MMPVFLPSALFTNQVLSGFSEAHRLSRTVVLVSRADDNQAKDFFMSTKLIESQASKRLKRTHPCILAWFPLSRWGISGRYEIL